MLIYPSLLTFHVTTSSRRYSASRQINANTAMEVRPTSPAHVSISSGVECEAIDEVVLGKVLGEDSESFMDWKTMTEDCGEHKNKKACEA